MDKSNRSQMTNLSETKATESSSAGHNSSNVTATSLPSSNQAAASVESIKLMAESIGIANLNDEATKEVINELTFTIKSIILVMQAQIYHKI